jgi:hypothetical protein
LGVGGRGIARNCEWCLAAEDEDGRMNRDGRTGSNRVDDVEVVLDSCIATGSIGAVIEGSA